MAPSAQWALHDFVRLAGEEGCKLYFEQFFNSGFAGLPTDHQKRYPGLQCWGGLDEMRAVLAGFAGLPVGSRRIVAGRSANLMKLIAKLLFQAGKHIVITDLTWPSYQRILERELTSYTAGVVRLAMPSVPLSTCQAGSLIQALALVQPHASYREFVEALSA